MVVKQQGWPLSSSTTSSQIKWEEAAAAAAEKNENESIDSLEACLRSSTPSSDDCDTFEKMEQALQCAVKAGRPNPNPISRYSSRGIKKQRGGDIDLFTLAETNPFSEGTFTEDDTLALTSLGSGTFFSADDRVEQHVPNDKRKQSKDEISRAIFDANRTVHSSTQGSQSRFDDDYVSNMVEDTKRRRSRKKVEPSYWQSYDLETVESTMYTDDEPTMYLNDEVDNSTLTGTFDSEGEGTTPRDDGGCLGLICPGDLWLRDGEDEMPYQITKEQWARRKKNRRKSSNNAQEDATLEGTLLSEYTREDTLENTVLSGSTKGGTLTSGSFTAEYEMPVSDTHALFTEPEFLMGDDVEENELTGNKAFDVIHNVCSGSLFHRSGDAKGFQLFIKQSFQSKGEGATMKTRSTAANESEVATLSVKDHLERVRSRQSVKEAARETMESDVKESEDLNRIESGKSMTKDVKESEDGKESSVTTNISLVRTPSQNELKAIYERISSAEKSNASPLTKPKLFKRAMSSFRRQTSSKVSAPSFEANFNEIQAFTVTVTSADPKQGASTEKINNDLDTFESSNGRQQDELLMMGCEPAKITKESSSRSKLFSFKIKKNTPRIDAKSPASPARTARTSASEASIESRSGDDLFPSDPELCITRKGGRVLISI